MTNIQFQLLTQLLELLEETEHFCRWRQKEVANTVHCGELNFLASECTVVLVSYELPFAGSGAVAWVILLTS